MNYDLQYKPYGNQAILIEWPKEISESILNDIINFKRKIEANTYIESKDLITGYNSLTISCVCEIKSFKKSVEILKEIYLQSNLKLADSETTWQIPVCYDKEFGIDLEFISKDKNIPIEDIIDLHSKALYTVYFIGFLPGFLYLGGLDSKLYMNRRTSPRLNITKGSVGIGGKQTGIYPNDSAGGWNIIGKTPISFFDVTRTKPCFAKSGDKIQFIPVTKPDYFKLEKDIKNSEFQIKSITDD